MIGEFEFVGLFWETSDTDDHRVYYNVISVILFMVFLILITIIIMNLLVGLAVDDIKGVQDKAALKRLAMHVSGNK